MALPEPVPGLVISYEYLWRHDHDRKRMEAAKTRPCVVVVRIHRQDERLLVAVSPITHRQPDPATPSLEVPPRVKRRLGLDSQRSWAVLNELNEFAWPGFDLRPVPGSPGCFEYGHLPPKLFARMVGLIGEAWRGPGGAIVPRG